MPRIEMMNRTRLSSALIAAASLVCALAPPAHAAGALDKSFSGDGQAEVAIGTRVTATDVAMQGRAIVVGATTDRTGDRKEDFALARFTHSGALDRSFGGDGRVTTNIFQGDHLEAVAVQPDRKIVAVGWSLEYGGLGDVVLTIARYRPDGALDGGFSGDGRKTISFGADTDAYGRAVALFDDGSIAVAGNVLTNYGTESDMFAVVLSPHGQIDPAYGKLRLGLGKRWAEADEVQVTSSDKLLLIGIAGGWFTTNKVDVVAARVLPSGLDLSYGAGDGFTMVDVRNDDRVTGAAPLPHGRLLILARTVAADDRDFTTFVRLERDGRRDHDFGGDGVVSRNLFPTEFVWDLAVQDDGKPIVVGWQSGDPFVARFRRDGAPDRSFGGDGVVFTPTPILDHDLTGVAIQNDGRIVACGTHRLVGTTRDVIGVERLLA
jgi:uncharacterized delta-60 repeat protein